MNYLGIYHIFKRFNYEKKLEIRLQPKCQLEFFRKTPKNFDTHINKSIPLYKWTHEIGLEVADFFLTNNSITYDIDVPQGRL